MDVQIDYLANYPEFIPTLANWFHDEWGHFNPAATIAQRISRLKERCTHTAGIPITLVAIAENIVVGTASLVEHDMEVHMELSPWLSSVYVAKAHRGQGIGSRLVESVVKEAEINDAAILYLFTPNRESFYARLGWQLFGREEYRGQQVVLMKLPISEQLS
jgi:GNAT superfamily N-acetyltransferase